MLSIRTFVASAIIIAAVYGASFKYTDVKCASSNKTISSELPLCFIKAYSRRNSTLNIILRTLIPVYQLMVSFKLNISIINLLILQLRYDLSHSTTTNSYRSVINTTIDVCSFLNGTEANVATKWIIDQLKESIGSRFFHSCPYFGRYDLIDIQLGSGPLHNILPTGRYKTVMYFYNSYDSNIFTLKTTMECSGTIAKQF